MMVSMPSAAIGALHRVSVVHMKNRSEATSYWSRPNNFDTRPWPRPSIGIQLQTRFRPANPVPPHWCSPPPTPPPHPKGANHQHQTRLKREHNISLLPLLPLLLLLLLLLLLSPKNTRPRPYIPPLRGGDSNKLGINLN